MRRAFIGVNIGNAFDPATTVRLVRVHAKASLSFRLIDTETMQQVRHAVTFVLERFVGIGTIFIFAGRIRCRFAAVFPSD